MARFKDLLAKLSWKVVLVLILAGAGVSYYMLDQTEIESREQRVQTSTAEISSLEHKIAEAKEFEKQFDEKKRRYAELVKQLQSLQGALPRQFFLPDLLSDLLGEAKKVELEVTKFKPDDKETPGDLYVSLGFDMEVKGSFFQALIFLDRLANMKRLVSVSKFTIEKDDQRKNMTLGGAEGPFGGSSLRGGRTIYPAVSAVLKIVTYRYRGAGNSEPALTPKPAGGPAAKKGSSFMKPFVTLILLAGICGVTSAGAAVPSKAKKKKAAKAAVSAPAVEEAPSAPPGVDTGAGTIEGYLQGLSTLPDVMSRRDPFITAATPFEARPELTDLDENPSAPALERYPIQKYEVVATLLGDQYPRALVRLPESEKGKVLIVREKDRIGNRGGTIRKILKDGIAVVQTQRSSLGFIDKVETVIRVGVSDRKVNVARKDNGEGRAGSQVASPPNAVRDAAPTSESAPGNLPPGIPANLPAGLSKLPALNQEDQK